MIREALAAVARNESLGPLLNRTPVARDVVARLVGGDSIDEAIEVAGELAGRGFLVSLERAAPTVQTEDDAQRVLDAYLGLVDRVAEADLRAVCEVAVLPQAMGTVDGRLQDRALDRLDELRRRAVAARVPLIVGVGELADVPDVMAWFDEAVRESGPGLAMTVPAALRRAEDDCRRLADHRIRLVKGGHRGATGIAYTQPIEIDKSFVRCAKVLLAGTGTPSFATHDDRLVSIVENLVPRFGREPGDLEFAFYMGRQAGLQERLLDAGQAVRVYVPYGPDWFERLVGGLAEQPSSIAAAVRSLLPGG